MAKVPPRIRRCATRVLWNALVVAVYFGAGELGLLDQLLRGHLTPFWPATGVALAALLLLGWRIWPGIAIGGFLIGLSIGLPPPGCVALAAGNTLAPLLAYYLLRRVGFQVEINRLRDALALVFLGAFTAMTVSASVGAGVLVVTHDELARSYGSTWFVWWVGNATGILVIAPLLLLLYRLLERMLHKAYRPSRVRLARVVEAIFLLGGTFLVALLGTRSSFDVLFLVFPFLFWAAWRFQLSGAAPCVLVASLVVTFAAEDGSGPFAGADLFAKLITLQAFNASAALTGLLLAALVAERNHTYQEIERACIQLADVMSLRDRASRHAESWRTPSDKHETRT